MKKGTIITLAMVVYFLTFNPAAAQNTSEDTVANTIQLDTCVQLLLNFQRVVSIHNLVWELQESGSLAIPSEWRLGGFYNMPPLNISGEAEEVIERNTMTFLNEQNRRLLEIAMILQSPGPYLVFYTGNEIVRQFDYAGTFSGLCSSFVSLGSLVTVLGLAVPEEIGLQTQGMAVDSREVILMMDSYLDQIWGMYGDILPPLQSFTFTFTTDP